MKDEKEAIDQLIDVLIKQFQALSAIRLIRHRREVLDSYVDASLYYAKLCAMERGETFELIDLIQELTK